MPWLFKEWSPLIKSRKIIESLIKDTEEKKTDLELDRAWRIEELSSKYIEDIINSKYIYRTLESVRSALEKETRKEIPRVLQLYIITILNKTSDTV